MIACLQHQLHRGSDNRYRKPVASFKDADALISENPVLRVAHLREPKSEVDRFDLNDALRLVDASEGCEHPFLRCDAIDWNHGGIGMLHFSCAAAIKWARWQARMVMNHGRLESCDSSFTLQLQSRSAMRSSISGPCITGHTSA